MQITVLSPTETATSENNTLCSTFPYRPLGIVRSIARSIRRKKE